MTRPGPYVDWLNTAQNESFGDRHCTSLPILRYVTELALKVSDLNCRGRKLSQQITVLQAIIVAQAFSYISGIRLIFFAGLPPSSWVIQRESIQRDSTPRWLYRVWRVLGAHRTSGRPGGEDKLLLYRVALRKSPARPTS